MRRKRGGKEEVENGSHGNCGETLRARRIHPPTHSLRTTSSSFVPTHYGGLRLCENAGLLKGTPPK